MSETMKNLSDYLRSSVLAERPDWDCDRIESLVDEIVRTNFRKCLKKYLDGEQWKL